MRVVVILIVSVLFPNILVSQEHTVTPEQLEDARKDIDFGKTKTIDRLKDVFGEIPEEEEATSNDIMAIGSVFEVLGYLLLALFLAILIYQIITELKKSDKRKMELSDLDEIDDIQQVDLDSYLAKAESNGDFRLILRIKFLKILKLLASQEKIAWKKHKTNRVYTREMSSSSYGTEFRTIANTFDKVWYGMDRVNPEEFSELNPSFDHLLTVLSNEN